MTVQRSWTRGFDVTHHLAAPKSVAQHRHDPHRIARLPHVSTLAVIHAGTATCRTAYCRAHRRAGARCSTSHTTDTGIAHMLRLQHNTTRQHRSLRIAAQHPRQCPHANRASLSRFPFMTMFARTHRSTASRATRHASNASPCRSSRGGPRVVARTSRHARNNTARVVRSRARCLKGLQDRASITRASHPWCRRTVCARAHSRRLRTSQS